MLTCKQVATALASGEVEDAGLRRRLSIRFHLMLCRYCRCYARQIRGLGEAARRLLARRGADTAALERLEGRLLEHCREASGSEQPGA